MGEPGAASCPSRLAPPAGDARAFADRVAAACGRVLGGALASVILHGSLVLGDYTPG